MMPVDEQNAVTATENERNDAQQGLRLLRAFRKLSPSQRQQLIELVERRAKESLGH